MERDLKLGVLVRPCGRAILVTEVRDLVPWDAKVQGFSRLLVHWQQGTDEDGPVRALLFGIDTWSGEESVPVVEDELLAQTWALRDAGARFASVLSLQALVDVVVFRRGTGEYRHFIGCFDTLDDVWRELAGLDEIAAARPSGDAPPPWPPVPVVGIGSGVEAPARPGRGSGIEY